MPAEQIISSKASGYARLVSAQLSAVFYQEESYRSEVPVIDVYEMSETGGIISSNSIGPKEQKIGSVEKEFIY